MDADSVHELSTALAIILFVLSLTVYATALATKGADQQPNALIGIKTRATKSSGEAWVAAHRVAYPYMVAGATHCLISAMLITVLLTLNSLPNTAMSILSIALTVGAAVILGAGVVKADREARRHLYKA